MVGKDFQDGQLEIEDENLVLILIDWLPHIQSDLQRYLNIISLILQSIAFEPRSGRLNACRVKAMYPCLIGYWDFSGTFQFAIFFYLAFRFLSDALMKTVMYSSYNVMVCSKTDVMSNILKHLKQNDLLIPETRGQLTTLKLKFFAYFLAMLLPAAI